VQFIRVLKEIAACYPARVAILLTVAGSAWPQGIGFGLLPPLPPSNEPAVAAPDGDGSQRLAELLNRARSTILEPAFPPKPTRTDTRLQRAKERFESGRKLYLAGDKAGAKREFDRAVDLLLNSKDEPTDRVGYDRQFERLVQAIYRLDVEGLGSGQLDTEPGYDKAPLDDIINLTFPIDPKLRNKVREELEATASQLPLETSDAVLSYINFFSSERGRRVLVAGLRRQGKYKPMISRILAEEGVPQELIFLAQAESGFLPRAMSHKAAGGMWQFVKFRGQEYGLKQSLYVDDRFDPEKATRAAARHLRDLYYQFGDWYLAIAGYNCGPVNVERAVQRTGYADIWELRNRGVLPRETSNYVPIIVAMIIMAKNAKDYGIEEVYQDSPIEYDTVELVEPANLPLVADILGVSVADIRELNPSLLKNLAPAGYSLHIPKGSASSFVATLELIPKEHRKAWRLHRAEPGETGAEICRRYGASFAALRGANTAELLAGPQPGDWVVVPAVYKEPVVRSAPSGKKSRRGGSQTASRPTSKPAPKAAAKPGASKAAAPSPAVAKATAKPPARAPAPPKKTASSAAAKSRKNS
jgi:membrane-bound lytic murein transglycosylase D